MAYKIRKEKNGAYLFNTVNGRIKYIPEDLYGEIKNVVNCGIFTPKELLSDAFSAPSKVYLELTRNCTLNCKMCYNHSGKALSNELSTSKLKSILDELYLAGCFEIRFTGGEPTTRNDFFELVDYAKKKDFFVSVGTNGIWGDAQLKKISESRIDLIIISLEGKKEINDSMRGKGAYDKALKSIKFLGKNAKKTMRLNMTIGKYNMNEIEHLVKIADENNVSVINTMPLRLKKDCDPWLKSQELSPQDYYELIKKIELLRKKCKVSIQTYFDILGKRSRWLENQTSLLNKDSCAAGVEACILSPTGDLYGCAATNASFGTDEEKKVFIAGNVNEQSFMKIWADSAKWKIYRNINLKVSNACKKCKHHATKCFGNCFVSSYFETGKLTSRDPYCFAQLIEKGELK